MKKNMYQRLWSSSRGQVPREITQSLDTVVKPRYDGQSPSPSPRATTRGPGIELNYFVGLLFVLCLISCREINTQPTPIIGGVIDDARPYVVGVGFGDVVFCSGTLISTRTVLTAAHCNGPNKIFFGTNATAPTRTIVASQKVSHPGFSVPSFSNDLQLLFLDEDAPVQPAPLLREDLTSFVGEPVTLAGFGVTAPRTQTDKLRRSTITELAAVGPASILGGSVVSIDASQLYYQDPLHNTCGGDSGGPAFLIRAGVEHHVGVTSFGDSGCALDGVNARSDLAALTAFIQPQLDLFEANNPCRNDGACDESCNQNKEVLDPDCQSLHCVADGLCALSCVLPRDPDCDEPGVDHCALNGVCDPTCEVLDPDCSPLCQSGDSCVRSCATPDPDCALGVCGDGILALAEECDDGDLDDSDACDSQCVRLGCGDGVINHGEECDDGNLDGNDGCDSRCKVERCGDLIVQGVELCDDGDDENDDGCTQLCQAPRCGDGFQQISLGEFCDDGNSDNDDGCDSNCVAVICGDGALTGPEQCDDGNEASGDGCSRDCLLEFTGGGCQVSQNGTGWGWMLCLILAGIRSRRGAQTRQRPRR